MALDPISNLGEVTVSAGYDDVATSIVFSAGDGAKIPDPVGDGAYNAVWWNNTDYPNIINDPKVEFVRITGPAGTGDTKTVVRGQEGTVASTKNTAGKTYKMAVILTKLTYDLIKAAVLKVDGIEAGATADQSDAEIKAAYENNTDTNAYDDAAVSKVAGIEPSAEVTSAAKVDAAGAVMESDVSTAPMGFVLDEDTMVSDSPTKVATQQSIKKYVDDKVVSSVDYMGGYDAATNTPDLDTSPSGVLKGDMYTVTVAGTFFTILVEIGDTLIAEIDAAALEADWTIVNKNLDASGIKSAYESNADTNPFTDANKNVVENTSGANSGDAPADDTPYDATSWDSNMDAATKNALRDKVESMVADIATNLAKISNVTHTGDVTGSGALILNKVAISGQSVVTAVGTDYVIIGDTSDSGNLKKALVSDFAGVVKTLLQIEPSAMWVPVTNPAPFGEASGATTKMGWGYRAFDDTTQESAGARIRMADYDGGNIVVKSSIKLTAPPKTSKTVIFDLYTIGIASGENFENAVPVDTTVSITHTITRTELMPNIEDRDFSSASAWANIDINAYDETTDLTITATVADQYCTCPVASMPTTVGDRYTLEFDVANIVTTWTIKSFDGTQTIGTVISNGTAKTISFIAETSGGLRIVADTTTSSGDFDNFSLYPADSVYEASATIDPANVAINEIMALELKRKASDTVVGDAHLVLLGVEFARIQS